MSEERKPIPQEDFITLVKKAINTGNLKLIDLELNFEIDLILLLCQMGIQARKEDGNTYYIDCPFDIFISNTVFKKPFSIQHQPFIVESAPIENDRYCQAKIRFPKKYMHGLLCSDSVFESDVFLKGITFESGVAFTNVTFNKDASFRENLFKNEIVSFQNVTFKGLLQFTHSKFEGNAYFTNSLIESGVCFGLSSFEKEKEVSFENTSFSKEIKFERTQFKGHTKFNNCNFLEDSNILFDHITLHEELEIVPASIQGNINITSPEFEGEKSQLDVNLLNCNNQNSKGSITFDDLKTMDQDRIYITVRNLKEEVENVKIKFKTCNFYGKNISFKKVKIDAVNFDDVDDISGFDFDLLKPKDLPQTILPFNFKFKAIHKNTDEIIEKSTKAEMWASIYANLKAKADEQGKRQLGNDYFFWQLYFQKPNSKNWENWFYLHTSAYGLSVALPLIGFSLIYGIGVLIYIGYEFQDPWLTSLSGSFPLVLNEVEPIQNAIKHVANNMGGWFYPLYIGQHLIQGYLLFQIGAAIRNKVKR